MPNKEKIQTLRSQLQLFLDRLDHLDPEEASLEDVDQLIKLIEKMEKDII